MVDLILSKGMQDIDYSLYPSREFQLDWLRVYLTNYHKNDNVSITDEYINKLYVQVNQFALAAHLFWTIWALIQAEHSDIDYDFIEYVILLELLIKQIHVWTNVNFFFNLFQLCKY